MTLSAPVLRCYCHKLFGIWLQAMPGANRLQAQHDNYTTLVEPAPYLHRALDQDALAEKQQRYHERHLCLSQTALGRCR